MTIGIVGERGTGVSGYSGSSGVSGFSGESNISGFSGYSGEQGMSGYSGVGQSGTSGYSGVPGIAAASGYSGYSGVGQSGVSGYSGTPGGFGISVVPNTVSRYQVFSNIGEEVWVVSSSAMYVSLDWSRTLTSLTINRTLHGHTAGNAVIIRNTNVAYQVAIITSIAANSFDVTTTDTGATSGTDGYYSLGFTFTHVGAPKTGGILQAPTGDFADCQLLTLRIRTGNRLSSSYTLVVPASAINGAGANTSLSDCFIPDYSVRSDSNALSAVGATIETNIVGSYSTFKFGSLGTLSRIIILHF
jgi:hypothetical protein